MPQFSNCEKNLDEIRLEDYEARKAGTVKFGNKESEVGFAKYLSSQYNTENTLMKSSTVKPGSNIFGAPMTTTHNFGTPFHKIIGFQPTTQSINNDKSHVYKPPIPQSNNFPTRKFIINNS